MASLKERQRLLREEVILETAQRLIGERGYNATTMDTLAAEVGIAKATLYQHFASKEDLTAQIAVRALRHYEEYVRSLDPEQPALARLKQVTRRIIRDRYGVMDWPAMEVRYPNFLLRGKPLSGLQAQGERFAQVFHDLIEAAKMQGDLRPELPTPICLQMLFACLNTMDYGALAGAYSGETLADAVVAVLFEGMQVRRPGEEK